MLRTDAKQPFDSRKLRARLRSGDRKTNRAINGTSPAADSQVSP
jgi:hypothetical protein